MIRFNTFTPSTTFYIVFINDADIEAHTSTATSNAQGIIRASIPMLTDGLYYVYCTEPLNFNNCFGTAEIYVKNNIAIDAETHAILSAEIDAGYSLEEITKLSAAALLGKARQSGAVVTFTGLDNTTDLIVATTTETGDRTAVTLNV